MSILDKVGMHKRTIQKFSALIGCIKSEEGMLPIKKVKYFKDGTNKLVNFFAMINGTK